MKMKGDPKTEAIIEITALFPGMPGERAGLRVGDVLLQVGERKITRHNDIDRAIDGLKNGDKLDVKVKRAGKEKTVSFAEDTPVTIKMSKGK